MSHRLAAIVCGLVSVTALTAPLTASASMQTANKPVPRPKVAAAPSHFEARMTASSAPVTDTAGRVWEPRSVLFGSWKRSSSLVGTDIRGTADDALYERVAYDVRFVRQRVPAPGSYRVRLLFAENYWTKAGQRVFDVRAEGKVVAQGVDIAKAVGKGAAYDVSFPVVVRDGRLDLDFVAQVDKASLAAFEIVSSAPIATQRTPTTQPLVPVSADSFYYQDISAAPLAANSERSAAHLARQVRDNWGGVAAFNSHQYNASVVRATPTTPKVRVNFRDCQRKGYLPDGLFNGPGYFLNVPIPGNAVPASGTDKELTVYEPATDRVWEFWQTGKDAAGGWSACWGGRIDKVSTNPGIFPRPFGVSASGLLMAPGVISMDEFERGRIDHAMYLAVIEPAKWDRISWPANRSDGHSSDPDALAEGQRLRLDPSLDVSTLGLTPVGELVARAAQKYGFIVADTAGAVAVATESGNTIAAATKVNPWNELLAGPSYEALRGFPWDKVQVLPINYGKPTAGATRR